MELIGPGNQTKAEDKQILQQRVTLFEEYKQFLDQQHYAEHFDYRSNLHSTVLEEFIYYLFKDLVSDFGESALIGKSHAFKDIFFVAPNYSQLLQYPHGKIEKKDHDFVIGVTVKASLETTQPGITETEANPTHQTPESARVSVP
jgi:Bpu10I restriction endonuclease